MYRKFWRWTGLGEKKGWDIVTSLSIPLIVFGGGILFNYLNGKQQQEVAEQKQKDELLKSYINDMKGFLLYKDHPLKKSKENDEIRSIARTITLTTLTQLNSDQETQLDSDQDRQRSNDGKYNLRKGLIMQFLSESGLIESGSFKADPEVTPIISLLTADFSFANLRFANLDRTNLSGANLSGANLRFVNLSHTNLSYTDLSDANLSNATLSFANLDRTILDRTNLSGANLALVNLSGAILDRTNLSGANLSDANLALVNLSGAILSGAYLSGAILDRTNLSGAYLSGANLSSAYLNGAENLTNEQIKTTCRWDKAIYTEATWDEAQDQWMPKDSVKNQKKIDEIKNDKASDPKKLPNCN